MRAPMSALAIAMVKNEADIIEASVRHNLHFVDLYVVIDNASTDGTREILEALRAEGLPLLIVSDPVFGHFQSEKVSETYRRVAPVFQPDLVYLLDADEFIRAPDRPVLEQTLAAVEPGSVALLPWVTHLPDPSLPDAALRQDPLGLSPLRRRREEPLYHKAVIRRRAEDDGRVRIEQGNHGVAWADGGRPPAVHIDGAAIAHLPVRSVGQLSAKVVNGWMACVARNRVRAVPGEAYQWQQLHERIVRGPGLHASDLVTTALDYAQQPRAGRNLAADAVADPTPARYGELRHLALGRHDPLAKVALAFEQQMHAPAPVAGGEALDLAPLRDLVRRSGTRSFATTPAGQRWVDALMALEPQLQDPVGGAVDLLIAPELAAADVAALVCAVPGAVRRRVFTWPEAACGGEQLDAQLQAWANAGWEPDLLETMGARALASYAALRHGLIVLRPNDASRSERAPAVRALLRTLRELPPRWEDPPLQQVQHPLQTLALEAA